MSTAALLGALEAAGIPCSPVNRGLASLLDHPHAAANDLFVAVEHPDLGRLWQAGTGFEIDGGRGDLRPAPLHGADTAAVLREFGFDEAEVAALFASGAAIGPRP
jgi:crotonobetainyl-CoA:carnitine CoA-transferase CaiB-like acyl-CoA transferase